MFIDDPTSLTHPPARIEVPEQIIQYCDKFTVDAERTDLRYIDCLWYNWHPSHFNLETSLSLIGKFKPKKAVLTNLSPVLDYKVLKKMLPKNVIPAHDGLTINL